MNIINNIHHNKNTKNPYVPTGNYAVENKGEMAIAKVKPGKNGDLYIKGFPPEESRAILRYLEDADLGLARWHYAQITGRCYNCNRCLTDSKSLHDGIGPICKKKLRASSKI